MLLNFATREAKASGRTKIPQVIGVANCFSIRSCSLSESVFPALAMAASLRLSLRAWNSVAQNLTQAIELVNERRSNVHWGEYGEAVSNIYDHADALHTKLDTILDHENARVHLDGLEIQPAPSGGS